LVVLFNVHSLRGIYHTPVVKFSSTEALPSAPRLDGIITTPLAAREPYMAVDAASFNISIDSISPGFMAANGFNPKPSVPLRLDSDPDSIGIPSTTKSGLFPEFKEELPRTRMVISPDRKSV